MKRTVLVTIALALVSIGLGALVNYRPFTAIGLGILGALGVYMMYWLWRLLPVRKDGRKS